MTKYNSPLMVGCFLFKQTKSARETDSTVREKERQEIWKNYYLLLSQ